MEKSLDDPAAAKTLTPSATGASKFGGAAGGPGRLAGNEAFNRFKQADSRGTSSSSSAVPPGSGQTATGELVTVHQNTITTVAPYEYGRDGSVSKFYSVGKDGKLCIWTL